MLRNILEKSTHDYSGDGHFRVCANFCGAYFIIVRGSGLRGDRVEAGCRVPEGVDIAGECPKANRLKVETSYITPGDRHASGLVLSTAGTEIEFRIDEATGDRRSYYATPETVLRIREWLARVAPVAPFVTGSAAMRDPYFGRNRVPMGLFLPQCDCKTREVFLGPGTFSVDVLLCPDCDTPYKRSAAKPKTKAETTCTCGARPYCPIPGIALSAASPRSTTNNGSEHPAKTCTILTLPAVVGLDVE